MESMESASPSLEETLLSNDDAHQKLLDYSKSKETLIIPDNEMDSSPNLQQAANVPLPLPTQEFSWSEEDKRVIMEHVLYHKKMLENAGTCEIKWTC